ncbi:MAG: cell division protein FtsZ [Bacteroidota bacterium]
MQFNLSEENSSIIKVIGVGGGGSNAVAHMYKQGIVGVDFAICNTDNQAMEISPVNTQIQLGPSLTEGRGAGSKPNIGREACVESIEDIRNFLGDNTKMVFITAGMGGGTGTGAAPVIAKTAQEMDILTVGIVTIPFTFEGRRRMHQAHEGLEEFKKNVDTLIIISNDKLREIHGNLTLSEAFGEADEILTVAAKGIAEIITVPGYINVDFEDVNTVMRGSGVAIMGTATVEGENRARRAVEEALNSPLLKENNITGAQHILLNITSGNKEVTMDEIFEITEYVQEEAGIGTDLIWGNCFNENLGEKVSVTIIATGFEKGREYIRKNKKEPKVIVSLNDDDNQNTLIPKEPQIEFPEETENSLVYEFEDVTPKHSTFIQKNYGDPFIKEDDQVEKNKKKKMNNEGNPKKFLGNLQNKLNNPNSLMELENVPAYLRRKVKLDEIQHSTESTVSKWSITGDDKPELKENNRFLHGNVD